MKEPLPGSDVTWRRLLTRTIVLQHGPPWGSTWWMGVDDFFLFSFFCGIYFFLIDFSSIQRKLDGEDAHGCQIWARTVTSCQTKVLQTQTRFRNKGPHLFEDIWVTCTSLPVDRFGHIFILFGPDDSWQYCMEWPTYTCYLGSDTLPWVGRMQFPLFTTATSSTLLWFNLVQYFSTVSNPSQHLLYRPRHLCWKQQLQTSS